MGGHVGAPISAALELEPTVTLAHVAEALTDWLQTMHGAALESAEHEDLVVEWRTSGGNKFACQLVVSDSGDQARRTVTVLSDEVGVVAFIEEAPLTAFDAPHAIVDLSQSIALLLKALMPLTPSFATLKRGELNNFCSVDPKKLFSALQEELMPGLIVAVTAEEEILPSSTHLALLEDLSGLAIIGWAPVGAECLRELRTTAPPRAGSIVSITRTSTGLDAHVIASTSLRTKLESARRLLVRRQLSAPIPFNLERRRSAAMTLLLAGSHELDLPTALELLDEESRRANQLDNRVKDVETQLEQALEEQDTALSDLDDALSRLRFLELAFRDLGEVPTVEADSDDDWRPESSVEALMAAQEVLPFLVISATKDSCDALDGQQKRGIWAKKIWLALRALNEYCRAKAEGRFSGDIAMYRDNPPDGGIPLLAEYAPMESEPTTKNANLRALRMFNVPTSVEPAGKVYMGQHLKIDRGGQSAPRIHLHDDSGGPTQRIYVGYIGPHLSTSSAF
jgi:hypothetical protein